MAAETGEGSGMVTMFDPTYGVNSGVTSETVTSSPIVLCALIFLGLILLEEQNLLVNV